MKNILLATTALVATAGAAAANENIALSGSAEMGIVGGDAYGDVTQFHTDVDVTFTMSGEADNGLTFGATVDLDENGAFASTTQGGETIFIAYGAARLTMGDTDGAFDAAMQEAIIGGAIADDHEHAAYNGNSGLDGSYDGQIATFSYAASGFTGYASVEINDGSSDIDPVWGVGVNYSTDLAGLALNVGLGYQSGDQDFANASSVVATAAAATAVAALPAGASSDDMLKAAVGAFGGAVARSDVWGLSVGTTFNNGIQAIVNYSAASYSDVSGSNDETETHMGLALGYSMNALTVGVNYGKYQDRYGIKDLEVTGLGLAADYDLGGGLEAQFGYGKSETKLNSDSFETDSWSLGLAMSF